MKVAGVLITTAGAVLVIALLLPWWGTPPVFSDPPADASEEIRFAADSFEQSGIEIEEDAFRFYELKDLLWLATGIAGFALGLTLIAGGAVRRYLLAALAGLGILSAVLIAGAILAPLDYFEVSSAEAGIEPVVSGEAPFSLDPGIFVALAAAIALVGATALAAVRRGG